MNTIFIKSITSASIKLRNVVILPFGETFFNIDSDERNILTIIKDLYSTNKITMSQQDFDIVINLLNGTQVPPEQSHVLNLEDLEYKVNKVSSLTTRSDVQYPTTKAVLDYLDTFESGSGGGTYNFEVEDWDIQANTRTKESILTPLEGTTIVSGTNINGTTKQSDTVTFPNHQYTSANAVISKISGYHAPSQSGVLTPTTGIINYITYTPVKWDLNSTDLYFCAGLGITQKFGIGSITGTNSTGLIFDGPVVYIQKNTNGYSVLYNNNVMTSFTLQPSDLASGLRFNKYTGNIEVYVLSQVNASIAVDKRFEFDVPELQSKINDGYTIGSVEHFLSDSSLTTPFDQSMIIKLSIIPSDGTQTVLRTLDIPSYSNVIQNKYSYSGGLIIPSIIDSPSKPSIVFKDIQQESKLCIRFQDRLNSVNDVEILVGSISTNPDGTIDYPNSDYIIIKSNIDNSLITILDKNGNQHPNIIRDKSADFLIRLSNNSKVYIENGSSQEIITTGAFNVPSVVKDLAINYNNSVVLDYLDQIELKVFEQYTPVVTDKGNFGFSVPVARGSFTINNIRSSDGLYYYIGIYDSKKSSVLKLESAMTEDLRYIIAFDTTDLSNSNLQILKYTKNSSGTIETTVLYTGGKNIGQGGSIKFEVGNGLVSFYVNGVLDPSVSFTFDPLTQFLETAPYYVHPINYTEVSTNILTYNINMFESKEFLLPENVSDGKIYHLTSNGKILDTDLESGDFVQFYEDQSKLILNRTTEDSEIQDIVDNTVDSKLNSISTMEFKGVVLKQNLTTAVPNPKNGDIVTIEGYEYEDSRDNFGTYIYSETLNDWKVVKDKRIKTLNNYTFERIVINNSDNGAVKLQYEVRPDANGSQASAVFYNTSGWLGSFPSTVNESASNFKINSLTSGFNAYAVYNTSTFSIDKLRISTPNGMKDFLPLSTTDSVSSWNPQPPTAAAVFEYINSMKGSPYGIPALDNNSRIQGQYLTPGLLHYIQEYNAETNSPYLDGTVSSPNSLNKGFIYKVSCPNVLGIGRPLGKNSSSLYVEDGQYIMFNGEYYEILGVQLNRMISTTGGLQGGGNLSSNINLSLTDTGVTPNTYGTTSTVPSITVDGKGRVTAASSTNKIVDAQLTGLSVPGTGSTVASSDSILAAIQKLQAQLNNVVSNSGAGTWVPITSVGTLSSSITNIDLEIKRYDGMIWLRGRFIVNTTISAGGIPFTITDINYKVYSVSNIAGCIHQQFTIFIGSNTNNSLQLRSSAKATNTTEGSASTQYLYNVAQISAATPDPYEIPLVVLGKSLVA